MMLLAFPLRMEPRPDLASLDAALRKEWFHEDKKSSHLSLFMKREDGDAEVERNVYFDFKENVVMSTDNRKMNVDEKFLKLSGNHYTPPGTVVWAREWKGVFWPAVVIEEETTGNLARRDPEDKDEVYDRYRSLQWHVVFLGREWKRIWARDGFDTFKKFQLDFDIANWLEKDSKEILRLQVSLSL